MKYLYRYKFCKMDGCLMGEIVSCCNPQDVTRLTEAQLIERYHCKDPPNPQFFKSSKGKNGASISQLVLC